RRRKVPEGRWVLREAFSIETTRIPPTTPATQRRTCSLGNAAVCAPPSPPMKRSIAAKPIRDEPTTIKRCADDIAWASVRERHPERGTGCHAAGRSVGVRLLGHAVGDLDGDGRVEQVSVRADDRRPVRCRYLLVVRRGARLRTRLLTAPVREEVRELPSPHGIPP